MISPLRCYWVEIQLLDCLFIFPFAYDALQFEQKAKLGSNAILELCEGIVFF